MSIMLGAAVDRKPFSRKIWKNLLLRFVSFELMTVHIIIASKHCFLFLKPEWAEAEGRSPNGLLSSIDPKFMRYEGDRNN